jgi:CRP-like cAMP-binding protein
VTEQSGQPEAIAVYTFADADLFGELAPEQRARVERAFTTVDYPPGQIFYAPEESGDRLYMLRRGRVRIYKLSPEGRALTLLILEPSSIFGEMALAEDWVHDSFAESMTECTVGVIRRDDMRRALNAHPAVALRFMSVMSRRLRALEHKLADIAFKSVPQRLATVLLNLADAHTGRPSPGAPLAVVRYTHQQLAEMIGSYRETVTKAIGEFREAGLIRVDEETIFLTDLARLREIAGR